MWSSTAGPYSIVTSRAISRSESAVTSRSVSSSRTMRTSTSLDRPWASPRTVEPKTYSSTISSPCRDRARLTNAAAASVWASAGSDSDAVSSLIRWDTRFGVIYISPVENARSLGRRWSAVRTAEDENREDANVTRNSSSQRLRNLTRDEDGVLANIRCSFGMPPNC